jgi:hypothetical protein
MGCERRIVASTESFATAPFLLRETQLVTLVPRRLGERLRQAAEIRLIEPPFDVPPLREKLICEDLGNEGVIEGDPLLALPGSALFASHRGGVDVPRLKATADNLVLLCPHCAVAPGLRYRSRRGRNDLAASPQSLGIAARNCLCPCWLRLRGCLQAKGTQPCSHR